MEETNALAILFANTRRNTRTSNLIEVANATNFVVERYGVEETARKVGLSKEMIREFLKVLELPMEIQAKVESREIDSVDITKRLLSLLHHGISEADIMQFIERNRGLRTEDLRDVERLVKKSGMSLIEAMDVVGAAKKRSDHLFILSLDDATYQRIKRIAKTEGVDESSLAKRFIQRCIDSEVS